MRKLLFIISLLLSSMVINAIPLFPFFTDVAGDYNDGTLPELAALDIYCRYSKKPSFYTSLAEADAFLKDVLPTSNYPIDRKEVKKDGSTIVTYFSPMEGTKVSVLYLVEIPGKGFFTGYAEPDTSESQSNGGYF